jgi:hypothetical protein
MKGMIKIILPILLSILYLNVGCGEKEGPNCHTHITSINSSDCDIYFNTAPDTTGFYYYAPSAMVANAFRYKINARDKKDYAWMKNGKKVCIEYDFTVGTVYSNGKYAPLDSLRVYILDAHVLEQDLAYKTLKRYDLSLYDLQELDWTISYPPTEAMKGMKMYPPYGKD